jgi:hypothetical protein
MGIGCGVGLKDRGTSDARTIELYRRLYGAGKIDRVAKALRRAGRANVTKASAMRGCELFSGVLV